MTAHRTWRRRAASWLVVMGLLSGITALVGARPAAADVDNPGPIVITVTGGVISLQNGDFEVDLAGEEGSDPITMTGEIAADGRLTIPKENVVFPVSEIDAEGIPVVVTITAEDDVANAFINPATGNARADLTFNIHLDLRPNVNAACTLVVPLSLDTATPGSAPYNKSTGALRVADDRFAVPLLTPQASLPFSNQFCPIVGGQLGLPAPSGANHTVLHLVTDPILEGDEGDDPDVAPRPTPVETPTTTTTTAAPAPPATEPPVTEPPAPAPAEWFLPGGTINPGYVCRGADDDTQTLLDLLGDGPLEFSPELRMDPLSPSPGQGEVFTPSFTAIVRIDAELVDTVRALGIEQVSVSNVAFRVMAHEGITGDDIVQRPPDQSFTLVAGAPVSMTVGPFGGPFTRTSNIGETVAWAVGPMELTIATDLAGAPVTLNLTCDPVSDAILSMVDQQGSAPAEAARGVLPATGGPSGQLLAVALLCLLLGLALLVVDARRTSELLDLEDH